VRAQERCVYMYMEQWARVGRKVLMEGRSKRSVMKEEKLHWETLQSKRPKSRPLPLRGPIR